MEDLTVKAGLLMEAADSHRSLADAALERLREHTAGLDAVVRDEIRATLIEELRGVTREGQRAALNLRHLGRAAGVRLALWSLGSAAMAALVPISLAAWFVPTNVEVARLQAARDELTLNLARLSAQGARAQLRRCGADRRLCVRVDRSAPAYGEGADYLVIKGY